MPYYFENISNLTDYLEWIIIVCGIITSIISGFILKYSNKSFTNKLSWIGIVFGIIIACSSIFIKIDSDRKEKKYDSKFKKQENEVDSLRRENIKSEFGFAEIAVMTDDRQAFDKILIWANDKSYPFNKQAVDLRKKVLNWDYTSIFVVHDHNISSKSIYEIVKLYEVSKKEVKSGLIIDVWKSTKHSKNEKLKFIIDVIKQDESLTCVVTASSFIINKYGLHFKPLEIDKILEWWEKNKNKI